MSAPPLVTSMPAAARSQPVADEGRRLISIVSPCYNEAAVIGLFYEALCRVMDGLPEYDFEMVLVDDGSADRTLEALNRIAERDPRVRVASFSRNFGHQIALTAGLDFAAGDAVIMMDSDLQHPPSLIPELIRGWREGHDIVAAVREDTEGVSIFKKTSSRVFYWLINALSAVRIPEGVADFCLVSRRVARELQGMRERHRFLRGMIAWSGFTRAFVPYRAAARAAGESKYTLLRMVGLALDAIVSFSTVPIRLATRVGFAITILGFLYLAWNLIKAYTTGRMAPGWASLLGVVMIMSGAQLIFIGLIGQYLARVFEELKGRPMYILAQEPSLPLHRGPAAVEAAPAGGTRVSASPGPALGPSRFS
ncbi:MAG TPA: glycosyltransferase family 2 protein [Candidatus Methylomirabilis sp.]|nr:glycosyltransferase family 2 protein [Candidatus Methylomirabilis sp.]